MCNSNIAQDGGKMRPCRSPRPRQLPQARDACAATSSEDKEAPEQASSRHKKTVALKTYPTQKTGRRGRGERRKDATNRK